MIHALRACLRSAGTRRLIGVVALVAFVLVVFLSASHAAEKADAAHDRCGVCDASMAVFTGEALAAPSLVQRLDEARHLPRPESTVSASAAPQRSHAPRGPPSLA